MLPVGVFGFLAFEHMVNLVEIVFDEISGFTMVNGCKVILGFSFLEKEQGYLVLLIDRS